jgi:hypothetical protein
MPYRAQHTSNETGPYGAAQEGLVELASPVWVE